MHLQFVLARSLPATILAVALAAGFTAPAPASAAPHRAVPDDTPVYGRDKIHLSSALSSTMSVGPSGGTLSSSSSGSDLSVDYCVELDLTDDSSGPYRLTFHVDGAGGDSPSSAPRHPITAAWRRATRHGHLPLDGGVTLTFELDTAADAWMTTTGDTDLLGAIYDDSSTLVAADDGSGRIAVTLPAGTYTFLIQGSDALTGDFTASADLGTCDEE